MCRPTEAAEQIVPIIGDRQPDAAVTMKLGDGSISGKRMAPSEMAWSATSYPRTANRCGRVSGQHRCGRLSCKAARCWSGPPAPSYSVTPPTRSSATTLSPPVVDAGTLAPIWSENRNSDGTGKNGSPMSCTSISTKRALNRKPKEVVHKFDTPIPAYDFEWPFDKVAFAIVCAVIGRGSQHILQLLRCRNADRVSPHQPTGGEQADANCNHRSMARRRTRNGVHGTTSGVIVDRQCDWRRERQPSWWSAVNCHRNRR